MSTISLTLQTFKSTKYYRPVGAHRAGVPGREAPHDLLLVTRGLGAAVDEGRDVARHVEEHHVVAWGEKRKVKNVKFGPRMEF